MQRIVIERKSGVTLYGKVIGNKGKLGQFEVESDFIRSSGNVYSTYAEAERAMASLIGASQSKENNRNN